MDLFIISKDDSLYLKKLIFKNKIRRVVKLWRKRSKNSKQRFYKLSEWFDTQKNYLSKLQVIQDEIKKPLLQSEMIQPYEQSIIFPNLQSMIKLGEEMKGKVNQLLQSWNPVRTILAPTVNSLSIYLKIYKDYSNNYKKTDSKIQQLKKNPKFKQVVKVLSPEDYLFKPIQRPLQYKLFITDYIKLLPKDHIDRKDLQISLQVLLKIADEINDFVQKQLRNQKMVYLQNTFGNIIESTRQYKTSFEAFHPDFPCRVYIFNDLLLVVKTISQIKQQKYTYIYLDGSSYCINQPDCKNFKNRLYICGQFQSIHLTFRSQEQSIKNTQLLQSTISALYQKQQNRSQLLSRTRAKRETMVMNRHSMNNQYRWKQQYEYKTRLKVEVVGVQKRLYEKDWKIVFVIKVTLGKPETIFWYMFAEIQQLKEVQRYIKQIYPNLKVPSLDTRLKGMLYQDFKCDFTKYYEYRCILIQDFLNFVFRSRQICKKPQFVFFKLQLHQLFWDYLNRFSPICVCEACMKSQQAKTIKKYRQNQQRIKRKQFHFCIINAFQNHHALSDSIKKQGFKDFSLDERLIFANCRANRLDYNMISRGQFGKRICFHVKVKIIGEDSQVFIQHATTNDTCRQIVEQVLAKKGILETQDFCLVYVHGSHEYYLDRDEYVYEAVKHLEEQYRKMQSDKKYVFGTTRNSLLTAFSKNFDDFGDMLQDHSVSGQPKLYVRKFLTLSPEIQYKSCQMNPVRYPLVIGEMLRRFQDQTLLLNGDETKLFCALVYGAQEYNTIVFSKNVFCEEQKIKKYFHESKKVVVNAEFLERVREIIETNVRPLTNIILLYHAILQQFGHKIGWVTQFFPCIIQNSQVLNVKQRNFLIGVNTQKVVIYRRLNNASLCEFQIQKLKYRISGDTFFIDQNQKEIRLSGNYWLFFEQIIVLFKNMLQIQRN